MSLDLLEQASVSDEKTRPVRLGIKALELAKVAAGIKGQSITTYVTTVIAEVANRDIEEWYRQRAARSEQRGRRPKGE